MLRVFKLFLLAMVIVLNVSVVHSFVVMDPSQALKMDMFGRDRPNITRKTSSSKSSSPTSAPQIPSVAPAEGTAKTIVIEGDGEKLPTSFDDVVDKEGMLQQLFPQRGQKKEDTKILNLDMTSKITIRARAPIGYTIRVIVPEEEHEEWRIDSKEKTVETQDSQKYNDYRLLVFKTVKSGSEVIYLDSFDTSVEPIRPLESRIIRLSVTP